MKLTRRQVLAGAVVGVVGAGSIYELVDQLSGGSPPRAAGGQRLPEQHLLDGIQVVKSDGVEVLVPPLHHEILTARVVAGRADLPDAQASLAEVLRGIDADYEPTPAGLGVTAAWGLPYFERLTPDALRRYLPHDRRAGKPVLFDAERFQSDPDNTRLESNDVAFLIRSDVRAHIDDATKRLRDSKLFELTSIRRGFAGGGFDGSRSLPKQMAEAAQIPGADLIPETAELYLGFTSTQRGGMGPGQIANFETLGYVDFRGSDYFVHGTHMHLSHIHEDVEAWYLNFDFDERVATAFRPNLDVKEGTQTVRQGPQDVSSTADVHKDYQSSGRIGHSAAIQTTSRLDRDVAVGRPRLPEGHGGPGARRLQHAGQPVHVVGEPRRDRRAAGRRRALRRVQPDGRRLSAQPPRDGRTAAGRDDRLHAAGSQPGLQLDPLDDAPPELPRAAAPPPQLPARGAVISNLVSA